MRALTVVGARPQFVKLAPVSRAMQKSGQIEDLIVHTGQHYDAAMSDVFFEQLNIPLPDVNLNVGSGSHGAQTGRMLEEIEKVLVEHEPEIVIVYGDTNSTLAGALAAAKLHIPIAHIEAGLRSFDRDMPEEVNRIVADHLSTLLFAPTRTAMENLSDENLEDRARFVGDVMYDAIIYNREIAAARSGILDRLEITDSRFAVATLHRAANTDTDRLGLLLQAMNEVAETVMPIVFAVHPRTRARVRESLPDWKCSRQLRLVDPVSYLDMIRLVDGADLVLTDSGGLQKEALFLATPCVTLRDETEWPETVETGWNTLAGCDAKKILSAAAGYAEADAPAKGSVTDAVGELFGTGHASESIVQEILARAA